MIKMIIINILLLVLVVYAVMKFLHYKEQKSGR